MISLNEIEEKVEISYPCRWQYKLIGFADEDIHGEVVKIVSQKVYDIKPSKSSSGGKFVSLNLEVLLHSDEERLVIYEELRRCDCIKYVL